MSNTPSYSYPPPETGTRTSSMAIISMISGIAAWLGVFGLGGLLAVIFGHIAKNEIRKSNGALAGSGMATAGLVLGYANIALTIVGACFFVLVFAGILSTPLFCAPFLNEIQTSFSTIP